MAGSYRRVITNWLPKGSFFDCKIWAPRGMWSPCLKNLENPYRERNDMSAEQENLKRMAFALGGGAIGALLVQSRHDEAKKSRAERDDPEGVAWLRDLIGHLLDDWTPRTYDTEDEYTEALFRFLNRRIPKEIEEDDEVEV